MFDLVIKLRRLSIEEIEIATGRKFKELRKETNSRNTQSTKKLDKKHNNKANSKKKSDEVFSKSEKSSNSETHIHTRKGNQHLTNSNEKANAKRSVKNKLTHSQQSTNLATAGDIKTKKENENSKPAKRRMEINDSEKSIKPNPKRQKIEKNQYASDLVFERVTRSVKNKLADSQPSTSLATAGDIKIKQENQHSKPTKRRMEINDSEKNLKPNSKRQKLETNQYATDLVPERVTRSKTRGQKVAEEQSIETKSNEINKNKTAHAKEEVPKGNIASGSDTSHVSNSKKNDEKSNQVAVLNFKVGEVVWAKIRGFPGWPARIEQIYGDKRQTYSVYWFNDYRTSTIFKSQVFKFYPNFDQYSQQFQSHIGLETAAREALLYLAQMEDK